MVRAVDIVYKASSEMKELTGLSKGKRGDFLKKVWAYANKHGLKEEGKGVKADATFAAVFGRGYHKAPQIMKKLGDHLTKM